MLAPTRELVSRLNQRARNHRLADTTPSQEIELGDGNRASVGDLIITRANDLRLRITATDWVKNGDRWTDLNLTGSGDVRVRHVRNGRAVTLPPATSPPLPGGVRHDCAYRARRARRHDAWRRDR